MSLHKTLDFKKDYFMCMVTGKSASGKTAVLVTLASEYLLLGKKVLFVSDDTKEAIRMFHHLDGKDYMDAFENLAFMNIMDYINKQNSVNNFDNSGFDYIFIDNSSAINLVYNQKIPTFTTHPFNRVMGYTKLVCVFDYVISLVKKPELTFLEKIKYFFMGGQPNIRLEFLKNRDKGKLKKIDLKMNFKTLNIKIY